MELFKESNRIWLYIIIIVIIFIGWQCYNKLLYIEPLFSWIAKNPNKCINYDGGYCYSSADAFTQKITFPDSITNDGFSVWKNRVGNSAYNTINNPTSFVTCRQTCKTDPKCKSVSFNKNACQLHDIQYKNTHDDANWQFAQKK